jgi:hypothetical protein
MLEYCVWSRFTSRSTTNSRNRIKIFHKFQCCLHQEVICQFNSVNQLDFVNGNLSSGVLACSEAPLQLVLLDFYQYLRRAAHYFGLRIYGTFVLLTRLPASSRVDYVYDSFYG